MDTADLSESIKELKKQRDAVIVAHNYQTDEVQEIADVLGDSLALSQYCAKSPHKVIVLCGVHFMAESAKLLSPEKTVLLPEIDAGCPMADMADAQAVRKAKEEYPEAAVVCYINTSAEVKAECDLCCTSSNAVKVIKSLEQKEIIFIPDCNLGSYIAGMVPEKRIILWEGYCSTHHRVRAEETIKARELHPEAILLVHPECRPEVTALADYVGSTKQILDYVSSSNKEEFIIGTEMGILYKLKKDNPRKRFYLLSPGFVCPNMKKTTLKSIYKSLKYMQHNIILNEELIARARIPLDRMLKISVL